MGTENQTAAPVTVHDPAFSENQAAPFAIGASDKGMAKGSQAQYKRESRNVSAGFLIQPALHGQFIHPQPPPKGDRW